MEGIKPIKGRDFVTCDTVRHGGLVFIAQSSKETAIVNTSEASLFHQLACCARHGFLCKVR